MQFVSSWATADKTTLLHFSESTLLTLSQHIQLSDSDREAGGILLGSVHGNHMLITQVTTPTVRDKRFRYLFERLAFGHKDIAISKWRASKGTIRYLGEWHTHPEDYPRPSGLDQSEWKRLSAKRQDRRPMLAVIAGRKNLYVESISSAGCGSIFLPVE